MPFEVQFDFFSRIFFLSWLACVGHINGVIPPDLYNEQYDLF